MTLVYLASPYSHADAAVRQARFDAVCKAAAELMHRREPANDHNGYSVFCPIAHSHPIALHMTAEQILDFELWMRQDLPILRCCERVFVLTLDGWEKSRGVTTELGYARALGIPIVYLAP